MIPKKPRDFIKPTAERLELPESLVDKVSSFYWKSIRKGLLSLDNAAVNVLNFGTFKVRYKRINEEIFKYENYIKHFDPDKSTFSRHVLKEECENNINKFNALKLKIEAEWERKLKKRIERNEYITNKALEEQGKNPGRDKE